MATLGRRVTGPALKASRSVAWKAAAEPAAAAEIPAAEANHGDLLYVRDISFKPRFRFRPRGLALPARQKLIRNGAPGQSQCSNPFDRHGLPAARSKPSQRMTLTWQDTEDIAWVLRAQYPDLDPLRLSFPRLRQLVLALPDFKDAADGCNEAILEAIQMAWHEETR